MGGSGGLLGQEGRKGHDEVKDIFITTMIAGLSGCTVLRAELDLQCVVGSYGGVLACESSVYVTGVAAGGCAAILWQRMMLTRASASHWPSSMNR